MSNLCINKVMIDHIIWPTSEVEDDDEEFPLEIRAKIGMYLRRFIETGMSYPYTCLVYADVNEQ